MQFASAKTSLYVVKTGLNQIRVCSTTGSQYKIKARNMGKIKKIDFYGFL
jgi:hypothetical protein